MIFEGTMNHGVVRGIQRCSISLVGGNLAEVRSISDPFSVHNVSVAKVVPSFCNVISTKDLDAFLGGWELWMHLSAWLFLLVREGTARSIWTL